MKLRICHLSDIHWRGLTRHDEYRESFKAMFEKFRELNPNLIFIGGDIVHSKTQGISPELIDCLSWWFTEMSKICPVHITLGNHDGLIMNRDRQDAITPVINALGNKNLHLYKKSGVYPTGIPGVNWCVLSCFDEETWADVLPVPGDINIAAYHGGVRGSETDIDWEISSEVDISFFSKFDFTLLGDIHKFQYLGNEKRIAYSGSTIQQNYGESPGKGFIFWEIDDRDNFRSTFYEIPHKRPFVTIDWAGDISSTMAIAMKFDNMSRFRIRTTAPISNAEMKQLYGELKEVKRASEIVFKQDYETPNSSVIYKDSKIKSEDLRSLSTHIALMRDFYSGAKLTDEEWKRLEDLTQKYFTTASKSDCIRNIKWSIKRLQFDNMFSYGKGNIINFDNMRGITGIFGRNRAGKSSIPGTIMYGLYNTTDRGAMSNLHVINMRKGHCETKIDLAANGSYYRLERQSVRKTNRDGEENAVTNLNLFQIDSSGNVIKDLNGEQRRETEKILREIVGTSDDFLLTSLASQGEMNNFIKYKASQRKSILTKFLDLEIFDEMASLAKADSSEAKALLANVPDRDWDTIIGGMEREKENSITRRKEIDEELESLRIRLQKCQIEMATSNKSNLVTVKDIQDRENEIESRKRELDELSQKSLDLKELIADLTHKIRAISALKSQFPISDMRSRYEAKQDLEKNIVQIKHSLETERAKIETHKKSLSLLAEVPCGDSFPTCKFIRDSHESKSRLPVHEKSALEIIEKLEAMKKSLETINKENLKEKIEKYTQILEKEKDAQIKISEKNLELSKIESRYLNLKSLISESEQNLAEMRLRVSDTDEAERVYLARSMMSALTKSINDKDAERLNLMQTVGTLESKIERMRSEKEKYSKLISDWRMYELFINAVSKNGIPLKITSVQLPAINVEISKILQGVTGFTVELVADPETNEMEIYLNYGDSKRIIECGSGMEKMMASLAIRVALINTTSLPKSDLLIIDEGFGALDDMNVESCTRLLNSLKKWFKSILVISHVDAVKDAVDNVLDITQKDMNAQVIYE